MLQPPSVEPVPMSLAQRVNETPRSFRELALVILWPAFVMAGVLEALVFVVVDPSDLQWFGVEPLDWATSAVYSVTFFIFWGVIATSAAITHLLQSPGPAPEWVSRSM